MKRFVCALILLAAVLALSLPSTASATEIYHFRGKSAWAEFYSTDPTGCISTSVSVFATESRSRSTPGAPTEVAAASFGLYQWNDCTWENMICLYGSVQLPDGDFSLNGNFASASLNTTIEAYDCMTGATQPVSVALTWTGDGEVFQGRSSNTYSSPGYRYAYRSSGRSSYASASGSLTFGGTSQVLENGYGYLTVASSGTIYNYN